MEYKMGTKRVLIVEEVVILVLHVMMECEMVMKLELIVVENAVPVLIVHSRYGLHGLLVVQLVI